jgi:hypothetical protein
MVKFAVTAAVGWPLIEPVVGFNERPLGNDPALNDQVYGLLPPVAIKVSEYFTPTVPRGNGEPVVISSAGSMVSVNALLAGR